MPSASAKSHGPTIAPVPAGTHLAICFGCIDVGTPPPSGNFPPRRKVMLLFELPHLRADFTFDGKTENRARVLSKEFTLSLDKKANLRSALVSWRGREFTPDELDNFEVSKVVGAMALVAVAHKKSHDGLKTYANITGIMQPMQGTDKMKAENKTVIWDIPNEGAINIPDFIPEWIQDKIKASDEYKDALAPKPVQGVTEKQMANLTDKVDEDVPFNAAA